MNEIDTQQFIRLYPQRAPRIMWFLGAGASASAGVPTASQMLWDFKRQLYCAAQHVSLAECSDLSNPIVQARIQRYFDDQGGYAPAWSDEYAFHFERAYPNEMDRRKYIERMVAAATPSYGHLALAGLLKMDKAHVVWTTNFDRVVEDAAARLFGSTTNLVVASPSEPQIAIQALNDGRWPLLGKLHGDFQSRRLRNTSDELQQQDAELRYALLESCKRYGLAVVGYSGRDDSVMAVLREAIADGRGYPAGLFWFHRYGSDPSPRVMELISEAQSKGIGAQLVEVETFDELMADVLRLIPDVPTEISDLIDQRALRVSPAPILRGNRRWPVVRLNALPMFRLPPVCRRFHCDIGGIKQVRQAVSESGANVIATRRNVGVLAFGSDSEVQRAFAPFNVRDWDVHSIETHRLRYESQELGLLYSALTYALERQRPLVAEHRRSGHLMVIDRSQQGIELMAPLKMATGQLAGVVPRTTLAWAEAVRIRLDFKFDRLWLLLEPTIWLERTADVQLARSAGEFLRARLATRYNSNANAVLDGWIQLIVGPNDTVDLQAFGIGDGIDANFTIGGITAFSWRQGAP